MPGAVEGGSVAEESPEKLFKHAFWDAATTVVYVFGALVVHFLLKLFGDEGAPTIVKIGLIALEIGFVLTAIGLVIASLVTVVKNIKKLAREFSFKWFRAVIKGSGAAGRAGRWLFGIFISLVIFINILVAIFVQGLALKVSLSVLVLFFVVMIVFLRRYRRIERELARYSIKVSEMQHSIDSAFKYLYIKDEVPVHHFENIRFGIWSGSSSARRRFSKFVVNLTEWITNLRGIHLTGLGWERGYGPAPAGCALPEVCWGVPVVVCDRC